MGEAWRNLLIWVCHLISCYSQIIANINESRILTKGNHLFRNTNLWFCLQRHTHVPSFRPVVLDAHILMETTTSNRRHQE